MFSRFDYDEPPTRTGNRGLPLPTLSIRIVKTPPPMGESFSFPAYDEKEYRLRCF
jgi:hypothetical protein